MTKPRSHEPNPYQWVVIINIPPTSPVVLGPFDSAARAEDAVRSFGEPGLPMTVRAHPLRDPAAYWSEAVRGR